MDQSRFPLHMNPIWAPVLLPPHPQRTSSSTPKYIKSERAHHGPLLRAPYYWPHPRPHPHLIPRPHLIPHPQYSISRPILPPPRLFPFPTGHRYGFGVSSVLSSPSPPVAPNPSPEVDMSSSSSDGRHYEKERERQHSHLMPHSVSHRTTQEKEEPAVRKEKTDHVQEHYKEKIESTDGAKSRSRLRAPVRPDVTINRSKRDANGRRYPMVSLLCYNVLSQDLIEQNLELYDNSQWLDWEYRKRKLLKELLHSEADILCLQEVHEDHYYDWYRRKLESHGFRSLYLKRTGQYQDGCALFYHSQVVKLLDHKFVKFQVHKGSLNRDNVGVIAKFQLLTSSRSHKRNEFLVATTHLLFNPKAGEVKLAQICYFLAELHKMADSSANDGLLPCILCGDFNSLPNSPLLKFLLEGRLDYTELSAASVAGYTGRKYSKYRHIPIPVLPQDMGIGPNCQYMTITPQTDDTPAAVTALPSSANAVTEQSEQHTASDIITHTAICKNSDAASTGAAAAIGDPPSSKRFRVATSPARPPAAAAILSHPFQFISCYPIPIVGTNAPSVTTYHRVAAETVDYILCTSKGNWNSSGFHLLRRQALPSFNTLEKLGPQPNQLLSSDHLYLCVELQLID